MELKCSAMFVLSYLIVRSRSLHVKVTVRQGTLIGIQEQTVFDEKYYYAFYGVPYAKAPVGKLRFKDPKPVKSWKETLDCTKEYNGACAQAHIVHKHGQYGFENCLHLNIYTPNLSKKQTRKRAVIVWIHGYAFTSSFSHIHGADFLIENDVVVVTLTHRIGVFGFLKLNESDSNSNMGLKDIVMGLKWIKNNIKEFGGAKNNITVVGSGSAGTFLSLLSLTKYRKLFSKMILQSGTIFSPSIFQGDPITERNTLQREIKKAGFKDVKLASLDQIMAASRKIYKSRDLIHFQRPVVSFSPIIERKFNTSLFISDIEDLYRSVKNIGKNMPILIGFTSQESISESIPFIHNPYYLKIFESVFKFMVPFTNQCKYNYTSKTYKRIGIEIKNRYFRGEISEQSLEDFLKYVSDLHKYPIYKFIESLIENNRETYVYKFNYIGKFNVAKATSIASSNAKVKGASHGDEICYIFRCNPLWDSYVKLKGSPDDRDKIFIKQISSMWANFAKTSNPTPLNTSNVTWLPMTKDENHVFLFDKQNRLINSKPEQRMLKFWNEIYHKYYSPQQCQNIKDEL